MISQSNNHLSVPFYFYFYFNINCYYTYQYIASGNSTQDSSTAKLSIVARLPHKRCNIDDTTRYKLEYFTFLDDRRSFANVDALLTRLAPVGTVYVACTESPDDGKKSANNNSNSKGKRASAEVQELLSKLMNVLESRNDVSNDPSMDNISVHALPTLSKEKATSLAGSSLPHLLGGETSEASLAYRGDKHLAEEPMVQWCLGHYFSADRSYADNSDETMGTYRVEAGTLTSHLALDRTAAEAIHLLPPRSGSGAALLTGGNVGNNSLFGVLNQCKTKMGSRTLEVWLRQPLVNLQAILRRQSAVAKLVEESIGRDRLREEGLATFRGIDIDKLSYRLIANGRAAVEHREKRGRGIVSTSKALESLYNLHLVADKCSMEVMKDLLKGEDNEGGGERMLMIVPYAPHLRDFSELGIAVGLVEKLLDFDLALVRTFVTLSPGLILIQVLPMLRWN